MTTYKLYKSLDGEIRNVLRDGKDSIPFDPANVDAQQFAKWLKDGGIPEAATENEVVTPEWITETIAKLLPSA